MDIGLLWFDDDKKRDLFAKVMRAAGHYQKRFGRKPQVCFVNPNMFDTDARSDMPVTPDGVVTPNGVVLQSSTTILMHHFWLGMDD